MERLREIYRIEQGLKKYDDVAPGFESRYYSLKCFRCFLGILYQLVVGALVPQVKTWEYPATYVYRSVHRADALQNNCLTNDRPIRIPMPIPNSVELHRKSRNISIPDPVRQYAIALVGQTN